MKTQTDLEQILDVLQECDHAPRSERLARGIKLLRSIELDAWREARELVDGLPLASYGQPEVIYRAEAIAEMDRLIQQLQLK